MKTSALVFACLTLLTVGCGPQLADQRDVSLHKGDLELIPIDPISQEQTIRVTAKSSTNPINIYVYLKEHEEAVERAITLDVASENLLAHQVDAMEISVEALVPANKEAIVRLQATGYHSAEVHLEITN